MLGTSVTDRPDWREFCQAAAADLTLLDTDPNGVLADVVGERAFRERRYEQIAAELEQLFGSLDGFQVLEIGGGYGGFAALVLSRWRVRAYQIVDLPEPKRLQAAYLEDFPEFGLPFDALTDLAISCYAVSECNRNWQKNYASMMALAPRGYVRWNGWTTGEVPLAEFLDWLPPAAVAQPDPEDPRNWVVSWSTV